MENQQSQPAPNVKIPDGREEPPLELEAAASRPGSDPCDVACDAMPGLVLGELQTRDQAWVVEHTRTCGYCGRMLAGYRRLDEALDRINIDLKVPAPPTVVPTGRLASYGEVDSPVGPLMIASTGKGVCEIAFGENETREQFLHHLRIRGFRPVHDQQAINSVATQLREYFKGERNHFEVPLDVSGVTPFTQAVLRATSEVPFGHLTSYRGIAERIGQPSATRAVGNALGRNPIPVIIPCHRIVRSDSSLGGYTGGIKIKERLLTLEGVLLGAS
jgi:methylated-DNA-[protein]-cysteine S-methyltransferase